jgi:heavy metal translocating P-type ATPase
VFLSLIRRYPLAFIAGASVLVGGPLLFFHSREANFVLAAACVLGGVPLVYSTLRNMLAGRFYVDTVAALAIIGAVATREYLAGALVVLMQSGGEALEDYGLRRANRSLDALLRRAPSTARRRNGSQFTDIPAREVAVGDTLLIRPGDIIAADGVVIEGQGSVDEGALTGEPVPLPNSTGDQVYSGTIDLTGSFLVRTTNTAAHSKYELIVKMVQQAEGVKAPINRLANRYTPAFTVLTLATAGVAWGLTGEGIRALAVLVVATPCPLIIATPLAVLTAINRAASLNIIVKSGAAVEAAGEVSLVVFDKTGTLTVGSPQVSEILPLEESNYSPNALLLAAAGVEIFSTHVLAAAVTYAARERGLEVVAGVDCVETPGEGVAGSVDGREVAVGSGKLMGLLGIPISADAMKERTLHAQSGRSVTFVAVDRTVAGIIVFEDLLRPEAAGLIHRLEGLSIRRTIMLTGDAPEAANAIGSRLGLTEVRARLDPQAKLATVAELGRTQSVMMVGDGINDAPALATASVGVAMGGHGAGIATDAADMVITVDNVERVADAIELGRNMVKVARQGILFGIGASIGLMAAASLGYVQPAIGALLQEIIDLAAILNALRVR